jgi:hypothetical protein
LSEREVFVDLGAFTGDTVEQYIGKKHGAASVIKRDKPLLTVCMYHNASDIFTIPLFVRELYKDYKLKIRHHTYGYVDTVLYAYT